MKRSVAVSAVLAALALSACTSHFAPGGGGSSALTADLPEPTAGPTASSKVRVISALDSVDPNAVKAFAAVHQSLPDPEEMAAFASAMQVASDFRTWMSADPTKLAAQLTPPEQAVLATLVDPDNPAASSLWREFFRGSVIAVGNGRSLHPRVGFYNPLADGWVMADFAPGSTGGMTLSSLAVLRGDKLTGTKGAGDTAPPWTRNAKVPMPSALALAQAANMAAFERSYPPLATTAPKPFKAGADDALLISNRMAQLGASISGFQANTVYRSLTDTMLKAIASGDPGKLASLTGGTATVAPLQRLAGISENARKHLELRGSFAHADGSMTLAYGSPFSGRWLVFADLATADGAPRLTNAMAVDLGQVN